jgi:hypothetical protein
MLRVIRIGVISLALVGLWTPEAPATLVFDLAGVGDPNLTAHVQFTYTPSMGKLDIDITNTSALSAGPDPRLTAFAFNVPSNVTAIATFSGPSGWSGSFNPDSIGTPMQLGFFDIAGLTGSNFDGGFPNDGIPRGSTFNCDFFLLGSGLSGLNEMSFLGLFSFDPAGPPTESVQFFAGRFQRTGTDGEGSDVAIPSNQPLPAPEPGMLLVVVPALAGLGLGAWRLGRRK